MLSTYGASQEQADKFIRLYREKIPLRAAAEEAGISIIQATMLARGAGILRITEAAIVNGKSGEIGIIGERIFSRHIPEAVNCNLSVKHANPDYDFVLNGCTIDIKTSAGINLPNGRFKFKFKSVNKFKTDMYILIVKPDFEMDKNDEAAYTHCFIIPSLFLLNHNTVEIMSEVVTEGKKMAWSEYLFPIEQMRENVMMLTANPEMLAIPPELKEAAELNNQLKKGIRHAKPKRNRNAA